MRQELNCFFNALLYYSRVPVPKSVRCDEEILSKAFRYLPLVGILLAALASLLFLLLNLILPQGLSILLMLGAMMFLTGCLHEDGFADCCDGFGGGTSKEHILRIMKDSHIGVYGVIGLCLLLGVKFLALSAIPPQSIPIVFMAAHGISRVYPIMIVHTACYAREGQSKAQHTRRGVEKGTLLVATIIGLFPLCFLPLAFCLWYLPISYMLYRVSKHYLDKKIDGFTGDTLGAVQELTEVIFYLIFVATLHP